MTTTTYLGSGDASTQRRDYRPAWLDNLADDVTMEGSVLTGITEGPEAIRAILAFARTLYDYQEFNYVGPYGDHGFVEDYTSVVRGEPIDTSTSLPRSTRIGSSPIARSFSNGAKTRPFGAPTAV